MKKSKLNLKSISITSFVTTIADEDQKTVMGGGQISNGGGLCPTPVHRCPKITGDSYGPTFCGGIWCWLANDEVSEQGPIDHSEVQPGGVNGGGGVIG